MKKMSQIRSDKEREKEVKTEKGKEINNILCGFIYSGVLDLGDFCLEEFERVFCTYVTSSHYETVGMKVILSRIVLHCTGFLIMKTG